MSVLSHDSLIKLVNDGNIEGDKKTILENVGPASIDLTLSGSACGVGGELEKSNFASIKLDKDEFVLLSTAEYVRVPSDMVAIVKGKSSLARKGLMVECAGFVDPGFEGTITLEVKNLNPNRTIELRAGMKICQIVYMSLDQAVQENAIYSKENGHHYSGQQGATKAYDD